MTDPIYNNRTWRAVRKAVLARDHHLCRLNLPGCTLTARAVDHIQEISAGGAWFDPANLQAACTHCNTTKENNRRPTADQWRRRRARITPPDLGLRGGGPTSPARQPTQTPAPDFVLSPWVAGSVDDPPPPPGW